MMCECARVAQVMKEKVVDLENLHAKNKREFQAALIMQRAMRRFLKRRNEWKCVQTTPRTQTGHLLRCPESRPPSPGPADRQRQGRVCRAGTKLPTDCC